MRAIVISKAGGPEVLELLEVEMPSPQRGEVSVRVRATAVNRVDLLQRAGLYSAPPGVSQDIPGVEYAGEVAEVGEGVTNFAAGDHVFGIAGGGTYAEYVVAHSRTLMRMPDKLSFTEAAAIPEVFVTAYDAMVVKAGLGTGESVLIHAVGSGVGTAAVQIAKLMRARAIGTARSAGKLTAARQLGLDEAILIRDGRYAQEVLNITANDGVNVVLELVGGAYISEDIACMANQARLILVGLVAGAHADVDLAQILKKRLAIYGTTLRLRPLEEKIMVTRSFACHMLPFFVSGELHAVVDRIFPLARAAAAHAYVASNENFGKVILQV